MIATIIGVIALVVFVLVWLECFLMFSGERKP